MKRKLPLRAVERSSLEEEVYRSLREAILSGELGEAKLVQDELAASLGVSRIPVRTALKRLENEHLVAVDERGGYYAKKIDVPFLQEIFSLRALLEPYATRMAVPHLSSEDIAALRDLLQSMRDSADDQDRYVELNMEFHRRIYHASGHQRLLHMIEENWAGIPPGTPQTVPSYRKQFLAEHASILAAIEAGDVDKAAALVEKHLWNTLESLISLMGE